MTRLLVLYTGGTIGMDQTPDGLAPKPGLLPRLLERFLKPDLQFDVVEYPSLIDSSAITPAHWNQLLGDLSRERDRYDGFVVIHGTDTMAYTASLLAFALRGFGKPVVVTGSQLPLVHPRSDGWSNIADALEAACQRDLAEVVIAFDRLLLRGCRARKLDAAGFSGFASPNAAPLARFGIQADWRRELWRKPDGDRFVPMALDERLRVACLFLTPGHGATLMGQMLAEDRLDGAALMSYGNGNAPAEPALLDGVAALSARGGAVLNLTQVTVGAVEVGAYAASQPLARAGAVPGADMTPEAAVAKLTVLLSQGLRGEALRARLAENLAGEIS
ncbi:asparaginase [uncultured Aquitalea sp.]|uniref:asparaginase n=1 Tax=uncultured Aquitalea sp. TaxID=540272 RepID=UPI0025D28C46|nr:asparaginase [uncultured Aquitalea sp.]